MNKIIIILLLCISCTKVVEKEVIVEVEKIEYIRDNKIIEYAFNRGYEKGAWIAIQGMGMSSDQFAKHYNTNKVLDSLRFKEILEK